MTPAISLVCIFLTAGAYDVCSFAQTNAARSSPQQASSSWLGTVLDPGREHSARSRDRWSDRRAAWQKKIGDAAARRIEGRRRRRRTEKVPVRRGRTCSPSRRRCRIYNPRRGRSPKALNSPASSWLIGPVVEYSRRRKCRSSASISRIGRLWPILRWKTSTGMTRLQSPVHRQCRSSRGTFPIRSRTGRRSVFAIRGRRIRCRRRSRTRRRASDFR